MSLRDGIPFCTGQEHPMSVPICGGLVVVAAGPLAAATVAATVGISRLVVGRGRLTGPGSVPCSVVGSRRGSAFKWEGAWSVISDDVRVSSPTTSSGVCWFVFVILI
uniref:Uncharacterized protein n=1 Tax=Cacopsylla melanoneura TaxID=428564 RepID=A0A8D9BD50_9HEMI